MIDRSAWHVIYTGMNAMKKTVYIILLALPVFVLTCGQNYQKGVVGKWNAGKATSDKDMIVTIRGDGTFTAEIMGYDMKPAPGTYRINKGRIYFSFPKIDLHYRIIKLDDRTLVMHSKYARLTWHRVE